jgi:Fic family protein
MNANDLYQDPVTMEPLFPEDRSGELFNLATELYGKASKLSGSINPITRKALADFCRPMNSYYSNLIEGHDTHPIDIAKALKNDFSEDKKKRDLQKEARAHIRLHENIVSEINTDSSLIPTSSEYIRGIHKRFYEYLPEEFRNVIDKNGNVKHVVPGDFRVDEVEVGRHIGPYSIKVPLFMNRFEEKYDSKTSDNRIKINRIIAIAAAHHRLAWIHPFLDGNGRVVRLVSDASFIQEKIDSFGLWSISRGLSRKNKEYKSKLAFADHRKMNDFDGRGNLSNRRLEEFCEFFLIRAIDQVDFMSEILHVDTMQKNIRNVVKYMVFLEVLRPEAEFILIDVFLKGKINKADAMRITKTSDKTLKNIVDQLVLKDLILAKKEGKVMYYYANYPISFSPWIFPGAYPLDKEADLMRKLT